MKTLLLSISALLFTMFTIAQDCSGLIISEVVEGWSNNKAIEVYNASPNPIDMDSYWLVRFRNQDQDHSNPVDLSGTLMPYEAYVVVIDKRDSTGVDFEAPVWDELQMATDTFVNPLYNGGSECMYFNGDDALMLLGDDDATVHDLFGKVADLANPDGWGPYLNTLGETEYMSENHTLIRKIGVKDGIHLNPTLVDVEMEWDTLPANTFDNLGVHSCLCDPSVGIEEITNNESINVFPNPVVEGYFIVETERNVSDIMVYSITGEKIFELSSNNAGSKVTIETRDWNKGAYLVNVRTVDNVVSTKRLIIK